MDISQIPVQKSRASMLADALLDSLTTNANTRSSVGSDPSTTSDTFGTMPILNFGVDNTSVPQNTDALDIDSLISKLQAEKEVSFDESVMLHSQNSEEKYSRELGITFSNDSEQSAHIQNLTKLLQSLPTNVASEILSLPSTQKLIAQNRQSVSSRLSTSSVNDEIMRRANLASTNVSISVPRQLDDFISSFPTETYDRSRLSSTIDPSTSLPAENERTSDETMPLLASPSILHVPQTFVDSQTIRKLSGASSISASVQSSGGNRTSKSGGSEYPVEDYVTSANESVRNQFLKTRICKHFLEGTCESGDKCSYAHSFVEQKKAPNLSFTRMCPSVTRNKSCRYVQKGEQCPFAHRVEDLRSTREFFKTSMCRFWVQKKKCLMGDNCRYAHYEDELRK